MKKTYFYAAAMALLTPFIVACGNEEPDPNPNPNPDPDVPAVEETYTPEESKEYLESAVMDLADKINPSAHKELMDLAGYFLQAYGNLGLSDEESSFRAAPFMGALARACANADASALTRAVTDLYEIDFNSAKGIYEPGGEEWVKVGNSDDVIFRFNDATGTKCEIKAVASSESSDVEFDLENYDWNYNPSTGNYEETVESVDHYKVKIPRDIAVTINHGGTELFRSTVKSNIDINGHKFNIACDVTAADLAAHTEVNANDSEITETTRTSIADELIASSSSKVSGSGLCNPKTWEALDEDENAKIPVKSFNSTVNLLGGRVNVKGNGQISNALLGSGFSWDNYDSTKSEALAEANKTIAELRKNFNADITYGGGSTVQATLDWKTEMDQEDYYDYWWCEIVPVIKFPDETTYEFEDYVEGSFGQAITRVKNIMATYENMWSNAFEN